MNRVTEVLAYRIRQVRHVARRATPLPVLLRLTVFLVTWAAFAVSFPAPVLLGPGGIALALLAAIVALLPGGRWPTAAILLAVFGWLTSTATSAAGPSRLLVLAVLLYLVHTGAALAAQVPYDAVVSPAVPARWLARSALVLPCAGVPGILLLVLPGHLGQGRYLGAAVLGLMIMAGLAAVLARSARR